jgi:succinate-semialdehyde dehydrogenase / glutarate-semialdehyde dehydrogenase
MMQGYPELALVIDGERINRTDRAHKVVNPASGAMLAELPLARANDLDRALETARRGFERWRRTPAEQRAGVLHGAARLLHERAEAIAQIATMEEGKTLAETRLEVRIAASLFEFYAGECRRTYGRVLVRPEGSRSIVVKEPVGPVAAFAPWNFPIGNPARKLGAPIAAGCSVILKPAEEAPASALAVLQALLDAGLPSDVAQVVFGIPDEVSRHLLASPIIRKLSFTGSIPVGKHLLRLAADTVKKSTMELGGHAPVLVFDDADLDKALDLLVPSKFRNSGQVCVSPTRFYVQDAIHDRFVAGFVDRMRKLKVGDGLEQDVNMGPTANPRRPAAIEAMVTDAVKRGGRIAAGGERLDKPGFFFAPTLLADVDSAARIMNDEPFGPIGVVARFSTFDEVIAMANRLPYGLAAYAFTRDTTRVLRIGSALESGMVAINTTQIAGADSPFGGVKESGFGSEDGPEGVDACMVVKAIHQGS